MSCWALLGLGIATPAIYLAHRLWRRPKETNEVLFFPEVRLPCNNLLKNIDRNFLKDRKCTEKNCNNSHGLPNEPCQSSLIKILGFLARATKKVDLCIYLICYPSLADLLIDLHQHNVVVRIITDGSEEEATDSKTDRLRRVGIPIRSNFRGSGALMHHKFAVVDDELLLAGSFNWTKKAIFCNYENVLVTSQKDLVLPFVRQFENLWRNTASFQDHPMASKSPMTPSTGDLGDIDLTRGVFDKSRNKRSQSGKKFDKIANIM